MYINYTVFTYDELVSLEENKYFNLNDETFEIEIYNKDKTHFDRNPNEPWIYVNANSRENKENYFGTLGISIDKGQFLIITDDDMHSGLDGYISIHKKSGMKS